MKKMKKTTAHCGRNCPVAGRVGGVSASVALSSIAHQLVRTPRDALARDMVPSNAADATECSMGETPAAPWVAWGALTFYTEPRRIC